MQNGSANTNGFDGEKLDGFISRIVNLEDDAKGEHLKVSNRLKSDRDIVLDEAKDCGIPKKHLRAQVRERLLRRQADDIRENFEDEDQDLYDQMSIALGEFVDTPLGQAAAGQ